MLIEQKDEKGTQLFPIGGTRVLAYPAAHHAVADGKQDYAFVYINVRIAPGRAAARMLSSRPGKRPSRSFLRSER